ncbi:MAG: hypothetical protein GWP91_07980 [Rhodobacterales bacterium]|nr:hypothetical protein [Rhodobacterales bacterium]
MGDTLQALLRDPITKAAVIADGVQLVNDEVAGKTGLRGAAIRAGFKAFRSVAPNITARAVAKVLPHFAPVIDPYWDQASATADAPGWFKKHDSEIAEAMLRVTDDLAQRAKNRVMIRVYKGLRSQAHGHVSAAAPGVARLIQKHAC